MIDPYMLTELEKWHYIINSIKGGFDTYDGMVKWLSQSHSVEEAFTRANNLRDGMICT